MKLSLYDFMKDAIKSKKAAPWVAQDEHAARALGLVGRWGWLRPTEMGRLLHPGDKFGRKYAEKYCRKLIATKLCIARKLPLGAGTAYVLSDRGAAQLNEWRGSDHYKTGKDIGKVEGSKWTPPRSWRHDLIAAGVLSFIAEEWKADAVPELVLRRFNPKAEKHPDGLIIDKTNKRSAWLEVEVSRKTGWNQHQLVQALRRAGFGKPMASYGLENSNPIQIAVIAIDPNAKDERGFNLDHWGRLKPKLVEVPENLHLYVAWVDFKGLGVEKIRLEKQRLKG